MSCKTALKATIVTWCHGGAAWALCAQAFYKCRGRCRDETDLCLSSRRPLCRNANNGNMCARPHCATACVLSLSLYYGNYFACTLAVTQTTTLAFAFGVAGACNLSLHSVPNVAAR